MSGVPRSEYEELALIAQAYHEEWTKAARALAEARKILTGFQLSVSGELDAEPLVAVSVCIVKAKGWLKDNPPSAAELNLEKRTKEGT